MLMPIVLNDLSAGGRRQRSTVRKPRRQAAVIRYSNFLAEMPCRALRSHRPAAASYMPASVSRDCSIDLVLFFMFAELRVSFALTVLAANRSCVGIIFCWSRIASDAAAPAFLPAGGR